MFQLCIQKSVTHFHSVFQTSMSFSASKVCHYIDTKPNSFLISQRNNRIRIAFTFVEPNLEVVSFKPISHGFLCVCVCMCSFFDQKHQYDSRNRFNALNVYVYFCRSIPGAKYRFHLNFETLSWKKNEEYNVPFLGEIIKYQLKNDGVLFFVSIFTYHRID